LRRVGIDPRGWHVVESGYCVYSAGGDFLKRSIIDTVGEDFAANLELPLGGGWVSMDIS